jgi:CRISPR-associated protein Cas5h
MDTVAVFALRGALAHYRRPDTLGTHATYPFLPHTGLRGLVASVLGLGPRPDGDALPAGARCGLRLLGPVRTVTQQLSLHGKTWQATSGKSQEFHRPTTIELVIEPRYRVYYAGPLADELAALLEKQQSHYHTYLGSAFCLTFPEWVGRRPAEPVPPDAARLSCVTVVPSAAVGRLQAEEGLRYARAGGYLREHIGRRRFRGTVSVLYEAAGQPVTFEPAPAGGDVFWEFRQVAGEGTVCLW